MEETQFYESPCYKSKIKYAISKGYLFLNILGCIEKYCQVLSVFFFFFKEEMLQILGTCTGLQPREYPPQVFIYQVD